MDSSPHIWPHPTFWQVRFKTRTKTPFPTTFDAGSVFSPNFFRRPRAGFSLTQSRSKRSRTKLKLFSQKISFHQEICFDMLRQFCNFCDVSFIFYHFSENIGDSPRCRTSRPPVNHNVRLCYKVSKFFLFFIFLLPIYQH